MATLSPFRYIQLCRYILTRVLYDKHLAPAMSMWKGKAKEIPSAPVKPGASRSSIRTLGFAAAMERQSGDDGPVAGPSREPLPPSYRSPRGPLRPDPDLPPEPNEIYRLMNDERLLVGDAQPPREVVVLCHGLYGFSTATPIPLFPSLKLHYWASVLEVLRDRMGANVVVVGVKGTGSVKERAEQMHKYLSDTLPMGTGVNFVAHSMGGLDVRHLISNIKPTRYTPLTLTTIGTPHRGSPFMDWCAANIGLGSATQAAAKAVADATKGLPYSLKSPLLAAEAGDVSGLSGFTNAMTRYLLNIFDSPAYANLTTTFCRDFNPETPDDPRVKYVSVAGRTTKMSVLHPLWFPKLVLDAAAEKGYPRDDSGKDYEGNDGLVSVKSAKWGEFLGAVDDTHHWDLRGEGGLWPTGFGADDSASEKAKKNGKDGKNGKEVEASAAHMSDEVIMPGGWDWDDSIHEYLGLDLASAKEKIGLGDKDGNKDAAKAKPGKDGAEKAANGSNDGWAATQAANAAQAQVGQLIDWVTDVLPGSQSTEAGKKRIQDAKDENKREQGGTKRKKNGEKDKFDLARFYGGLMLKLRDEGY